MTAFAIRPMTEPDATAIAAWTYPDEYAFYDWEQDLEDLEELLDAARWGTEYFAVDRDGALAGFLQVRPAGDATKFGLGLRPDLTGRGLGASFLEAVLRFMTDELGAERFMLEVAAFNERAIAVYERAGFAEVDRYPHETNGGVHEFVRMVLGSPRSWGSPSTTR